jgi:hypothetical protein
MTYSPFKPTLPKDFAAPALLPLDPDKSDVCLNSASGILGKSNEIKGQQSRTSCMALNSVENLPSWIRHHVGEAWSIFSGRIEQGGAEFCPEEDDPAEVCDILENIPEILLPRLEPSFIGLEREADPDGFFRNWYAGLCERYIQSMETVKLQSGADYKKRYRKSALVLQKFIPEFTSFFDSLREFIGNQACLSSRWTQGDGSRARWNLSMFERHIVWGGAAALNATAYVGYSR